MPRVNGKTYAYTKAGKAKAKAAAKKTEATEAAVEVAPSVEKVTAVGDSEKSSEGKKEEKTNS